MRGIAMGVAAMAMIGGTALAQRAQLPAECREQVRALCRQGGGERLRDCVRRVLPELSQQCRAAVSERAAASRPLPAGFTEVAYGPDPKQTLALARPAGGGRAPLLVFIHGGGWSIGDKAMGAADKGNFAAREGWAFATVNYRLVPNASVEQQAADIAASLAWLRANAARNGLDGERIVLMGHSAGAHLAALVATDPRYLAAAGVPIGAVKGVVLLDGAGYDVAAQMAFKGNRVAGMYEQAFGSDPARQRALSPLHHAAAPNAANWLILPVASRADSRAQSEALARALRAGGSTAQVIAVEGETHASLNRGLGEAGDKVTEEVARFLKAVR